MSRIQVTDHPGLGDFLKDKPPEEAMAYLSGYAAGVITTAINVSRGYDRLGRALVASKSGHEKLLFRAGQGALIGALGALQRQFQDAHAGAERFGMGKRLLSMVSLSSSNPDVARALELMAEAVRE